MKLLHIDYQRINLKENSPTEDERITRIREILLKFKIYTLKDLSKKINIAANYLSEIMNGKKPIPKALGQKIEDSLGVSRRWFERGQGPFIANKQVAKQNNYKTEKEEEENSKEFSLEVFKPEVIANISQNLKKVRVALGLNQKEFGEKIGYKQNTVSESEKRTGSIEDKRSISLRYLEAVIKHYHVNQKFLETGEGEMFDKRIDWVGQMYKQTELSPEDFSKEFDVPFEVIKRHVENGELLEISEESEKKLQWYLQKNDLGGPAPWFYTSPESFLETHGEIHWPNITDNKDPKNRIFEISFGRYSILLSLITKHVEQEYIKNLENEDFLESLDKHITTLDYPPLGTFRAFEMYDESMLSLKSPKDTMMSIPREWIVIGRKLRKRFWDKPKDYRESLRYAPYKNFVFVTKNEILIRAVENFDLKSGSVEVMPLNDTIPQRFKKQTIKTEDILEIYDIPKKESPYLSGHYF